MAEQTQGNMGLALSNAVADAVERAGAVTVLVNARRRQPLSGVLVGADLVLTANHGVERETDIQILLPDGTETSASLAGRDPGSDLALLRLSSPTNIEPARLGSDEVRVGSLVVAVGRPSGEGVQASFGMVNASGVGMRGHHHTHYTVRYLVTDAVPYPGFSGGPLVDLGGNVLGVNTSGLVRGMLLAIPAQAASEAVQNLAKHGHIRRGYLGIRSQVVEIPEQARAVLPEQSTGLLLVGIEPEGPAAGGAGGGLMVGDILVGLNGQPVVDHESLLARLEGDVVGKEVEVKFLRGGQLQTTRLTVGEKS